jgi:hypothetical protein
MWAADHYHWQWFAPVAALMTFVFVALTIVSALLWCHLGWRWVRSRGLRLGPAIFIVIGLLVAACGGVWGMFTWSPSGKKVANPAPQGADEFARAKIPQYGTTPLSQRAGDQPDTRGIVGARAKDEPGKTIGPLPTAKALETLARAAPEIAPMVTPSVGDLRLLIECRAGPMARKFPASGDLYLMHLFYAAGVEGGGGLMRTFGEPGSDYGPLQTKEGLRFAYRCEVTNYSSAPLANVRINPTVRFLHTETDGHGGRSVKHDNVLAIREWPIIIPKIEPGPTGRFTFWVINPSEVAAQVSFPTKATGQFLSEDKPRELGVVTSGDPIDVLFPQPYG